MTLAISFLAGTTCFANVTSTPASDLMHEGFFAGLGGSYNSVNLTQSSWGKGISNIQTSTGSNSNGIGQGNGAPFHNVNNVLAPSFQAGYFKHISGTPNLWGIKLLYQYLDSTATDSNLYIPQQGQTTSAITGITSPLYGYVNAASVQATASNDFSLLIFAGRSLGNTTFYFGAGPTVVNLKSKNFNSIGYAYFEGATINVTGLVNYSSPSFWAWGGAAQIGATYFVTPSWFLDMSYTYTVTSSYTTNHQQTFTNSSNVAGVNYTTSGTLYTKDTLSIKNQALMLTINKVFDV